MPQLDFIIVLPQVFWLLVIFISFYFILTYIFLPMFLRTISARNKFIKQNYLAEAMHVEEIISQRQVLIKKTNLTFFLLHKNLFNNLLNLHFLFFKIPFKQNYLEVNKKIFSSLKKSFYFCNSIILNSFIFYPAFLNKKTKFFT